ncbi:MAG: hypothetical protein LBT04_01195 [Prevotellaceae bacterium]|jgi:hypothetical protein|nr:hypothetical protein [Prevotellaceae bacterium]
MKKLIILLFSAVCCYIYGEEQIKASYQTGDEYLNYELILLKSGKYVLNCNTSSSDDAFTIHLISTGKYSTNGNLLILKDKYNGYKLEFNLFNYGKNCYSKKIFRAIKNLVFELKSEKTNETYEEFDSTFEYVTHKKIFNDSVCQYDTVCHELHYENYGLTIKILNHLYYKYYLKGLLFSSGRITYSFENNNSPFCNKLTLHDDYMDFDFVCYIEENAIVDNILGFGDLTYRCGYSPVEKEYGFNFCNDK